MFQIYNFEYRKNTVDKILKFLKLDILNDEEKQVIFEIVKGTKKTELQKTRFCMVYNVGPNAKEHNTYKNVASFYECSTGAIRSSVTTVVVALYHLKDDKFSILENILKKYEK